MDLEKAKRLLAKINVLVENADDSFSTLENDLLKTYIKDLYECVSGIESGIVQHNPPQPEPQHVKVTEEKHEVQVDQPEKDETAPLPEMENIPSPEPAGIEEPEEAGASPAGGSSSDEETPVFQDEEPEKEPLPAMESSTANPELEALFVLPKGEDLASKLSAKPIRLVEDAMGINDRISTINELFGRDHELFKATLEKVNGFTTYDQARDYLLHGVAYSQEWSAEEKAEKAIEFIRLVGRKFQSN